MWPKLNEFFLQPCCFPCGKSSVQAVRVELAHSSEAAHRLSLQQQSHREQVKSRATVVRTANTSMPALANQTTIFADVNGNPVASANSPVLSQPVTLAANLPMQQKLQQQQEQLRLQPKEHTKQQQQLQKSIHMPATHQLPQSVYVHSQIGLGVVSDQRQQCQMRPPLQMYRFPNRPPPPQPWAGAPRGSGPGVYRTLNVSGTRTLPRQLQSSGVRASVHHATVSPAATLPPEYRSKVCGPGFSPDQQIHQNTVNGSAQTFCQHKVLGQRTLSPAPVYQQSVSQQGASASGDQSPLYQQSSDLDVKGSRQPAPSTGGWALVGANNGDVPTQHGMSSMQSPEQCVADYQGNFIWDLKAGDLFGKSNEELTLLLIHLRRQSGAISACQDRTRQRLAQATSLLAKDSPQQRHARLQVVDRCKIRLSELDTQMETTRPLISLVDNMLKLSAVDSRADRRVPQGNHQALPPGTFAPQGSHQALLHATRVPQGSHHGLMSSTRVPHGDSQGSLQGARSPQGSYQVLSHGPRASCQVSESSPVRCDSERLLHQQRALQQELWRVRGTLSNSAKSSEEIPSDSARLERQMGSLHRRLQVVQHDEYTPAHTVDDKLVAQNEVQCLESELLRIQGLINKLSVQRAHLSQQVLTLSSQADVPADSVPRGWLDTDVDLIPPPPPAPTAASDTAHTPLYIDTFQAVAVEGGCDSPPPPAPSGYLTDTSGSSGVEADSGAGLVDGGEEKLSLDSGLNSVSPSGDSVPTADSSSLRQAVSSQPNTDADANTGVIDADCTISDGTEKEQNEDGQHHTPGGAPREKPLEIKTVRIVKRESQLRQKDKTRRPAEETLLSSVVEYKNQILPGHRAAAPLEAQFRRCTSLPRGYERARDDSDSAATAASAARLPQFRHHLLKRLVDKGVTSTSRNRLSAHQRLFGSQPSLSAAECRVNTPLFRSDAARQIVQELSDGPGAVRGHLQQRRARRHHTISGGFPASTQQLLLALQNHSLRQTPDASSYVRSADDMCMTEGLTNFSSDDSAFTRPASLCSSGDVDTPDVVKSSLSRTDQRFDESTIDSLLGTPSKIHIPERYVPEVESESLTAAEKAQRSLKAASIRKMLTHSTGFLDTLGRLESGRKGMKGQEHADGSLADQSASDQEGQRPVEMQRCQLLQLNQLLAKQVTEKSKHVAVPAEA